MSQTVKDIDYSHLSSAERILLAQELWDSVHNEAVTAALPPKQQEELHRRLTELESGAVKGVPWDQLRRSLLT